MQYAINTGNLEYTNKKIKCRCQTTEVPVGRRNVTGCLSSVGEKQFFRPNKVKETSEKDKRVRGSKAVTPGKAISLCLWMHALVCAY